MERSKSERKTRARSSDRVRYRAVIVAHHPGVRPKTKTPVQNTSTRRSSVEHRRLRFGNAYRQIVLNSCLKKVSKTRARRPEKSDKTISEPLFRDPSAALRTIDVLEVFVNKMKIYRVSKKLTRATSPRSTAELSSEWSTRQTAEWNVFVQRIVFECILYGANGNN